MHCLFVVVNPHTRILFPLFFLEMVEESGGGRRGETERRILMSERYIDW